MVPRRSRALKWILYHHAPAAYSTKRLISAFCEFSALMSIHSLIYGWTFDWQQFHLTHFTMYNIDCFSNVTYSSALLLVIPIRPGPWFSGVERLIFVVLELRCSVSLKERVICLPNSTGMNWLQNYQMHYQLCINKYSHRIMTNDEWLLHTRRLYSLMADIAFCRLLHKITRSPG